jgi:hypothetical protein
VLWGPSRTAALVTLGCVFAAAPAPAMSGEEWRRLAPPARTAYVVGIVDAWTGLVTVQESLGSKDVAITVFGEIVTCLRERLLPIAQVAALVEKYTETHPGLLGKDMPDIVFAALGGDCRK